MRTISPQDQPLVAPVPLKNKIGHLGVIVEEEEDLSRTRFIGTRSKEENEKFSDAAKIKRKTQWAASFSVIFLLLFTLATSIAIRQSQFAPLFHFRYEGDKVSVSFHEMCVRHTFIISNNSNNNNSSNSNNESSTTVPTSTIVAPKNTTYSVRNETCTPIEHCDHNYVCPNMQEKLSVAFGFLTFTFSLFLIINLIGFALTLLAVISALFGTAIGAVSDDAGKGFSSLVRSLMKLLGPLLMVALMATPPAVFLLLVSAGLTIQIGYDTMCRHSTFSPFVRPMTFREDFYFGTGSVLIFYVAIIGALGFSFALWRVVRVRRDIAKYAAHQAEQEQEQQTKYNQQQSTLSNAGGDRESRTAGDTATTEEK